jgi:hypothetical protein
VLRGFSQEHDIDFDETFSAVVKPATIRTILSIALSANWKIRQLDVKNAFLHGRLSEVVFCHQPTGFVDSARPGHVCRLNRALYGLKQAPRRLVSSVRDFRHRIRLHLLQVGYVALHPTRHTRHGAHTCSSTSSNKQKSFSLFYASVFPNVFEQQRSAQTAAQVTGRPELLPGVHCHTQQTKTGFPAADLSWIDDVVADAKQGMDTILNKREIKN